MKKSDLIRKQAAMMDIAEEYGVDDWKMLVQVKINGHWEELNSMECYLYSGTERRFALGVIEKKPVWENDVVYGNLGCKTLANANMVFPGQWSWNPPISAISIDLRAELVKDYTELIEWIIRSGGGATLHDLTRELAITFRQVLDKKGNLK